MQHDLGSRFESVVLASTGASRLEVAEVLQELWSGYGQILRIRLEGAGVPTVVVKHVRMPGGGAHPRGWDTDRSHARKVKSYEVETNWYRDWSHRCAENACRVPRHLASDREGDDVLLVLEDLDEAGFPGRRRRVDRAQVELCLDWLAHFHAIFMEEKPGGLWEVGTYWHLDTRPDELEALDDPGLKSAAGAIDGRLSSAKHRTLVHGDAKLANFCFAEAGDGVAAVDFQYVGGGCGMKDVAYFMGSCLGEEECESREESLLAFYFSALDAALARHRPGFDAESVIAEWRGLYPVAWTDFHRFLKGWSPGHWKINGYSERLAREVLSTIRDQAVRTNSRTGRMR